MANGLFGEGAFGQFMADPMTQMGIALLMARRRDEQGRGTDFGQQLGEAYGNTMGWQRQVAQMQMQQFMQQEARRKAELAEQQQLAQEEFRKRAPEYITSPIGETGPERPEFDPRSALRIGIETGVIGPLEAIQQAGRTRRYIPVGGNRLFDVETGEYLEGPPSPVKLGAGQMLLTPTEQGGYEQSAYNPRQFAPARPRAAGNAGGLGKPPSGYRWAADGSLEVIPGGPAASRETANVLKRQTQQSKQVPPEVVLGQIDEMKQLILAGERPYAGVVGPKGFVSRQFETAKGLLPGQSMAPTPALDYQARRELLLSNIRKSITSDPNLSKADRANLEAALGEAITSGTGGSAIRALDNIANFIKQRQGVSAGGSVSNADSEAWIARAMQANPDMTREQVIEEGKRRGKLR